MVKISALSLRLNFMYQLYWTRSSQILDQTTFWVRLIFKLIDWINQTALPNAGGPHLVSWRSEEKRRLDAFPRKRGVLVPDSFWTETFSPMSLDSKGNTSSSWDRKLLAFRLEHKTPALLGPQLADSPTDLRTWQPPKLCEPTPSYKSLYTQTHTFYWLLLRRTLAWVLRYFLESFIGSAEVDPGRGLGRHWALHSLWDITLLKW